MRKVLLILLLLSALGAALPVEHAQVQDLVDAQAAGDAAYFYSYLESIGDYNTEYDFIHPDARAVIPRAAVTGWFLDNYWTRQPQPATITAVQFVSWTWPVTGVTYRNTAEVSFTQVFWDGGANTVTNDVVRLVQDRNGVWRWFFGRNREFVDHVVAQYVPQIPATPHTGNEWVDAAANDLDAYWLAFFKAAPVSYYSPRIVEYDQATLTSCGIVDPWTTGAGYCGADVTIYLNTPELNAIQTDFSEFTAMLVLAHEWGHHVQLVLGVLGAPTAANELQADCLAGAWARDLATRTMLTEDDLIAAVALLIQIGDPTHGSGPMRSKVFLDGFYDGSQKCFSG